MKANLVKRLIFLFISVISYIISYFNILLSLIVFAISSIAASKSISDEVKKTKSSYLEIIVFLIIILISYTISQYEIFLGIIFFIMSAFVFLVLVTLIDLAQKYDRNKKSKKKRNIFLKQQTN